MNNDFLLYLFYSYFHIKPACPISLKKYTIVSSQLLPSCSWETGFSSFLKHLIRITLVCPWGLEKKVVVYTFLTLVGHPITACVDWGRQS